MTEQQKGNPRQHLAGGRPWRWVFESLRAAHEPASLIPSLLLLYPNIVHCCSELPSQEVADDVTLIVQAVSDRWLPIDGAETARICRLTCIFIRCVFQRLQLVFNGDSRLALTHFFQGTITSASTVILLGEEGGTEAGRAKVEAVAALGQFLLQALNGGLFSMDDVSELVLFLSGLIRYPVTPVPALQITSRSPSESQDGSNIDEVEVQRLTFVVLGSLISQSRPLVSGDSWTTAVQALLVILDSIASKKTLVEDYAASRYYVDLLRCVYITVSKPEERLKEHVGAFVVALRMFFLYGLNVCQGEATSSSTCQEDTGRSFIFHAMEGFELPTDGGSVCVPDTVDSFSFIPFESQADVPAEAAFRDKSSELRMYSIGVIQAISRADPGGFKKCSNLLLLSDNVGQSRSDETTLLNILRFEPLAKIRVAAATILVVMLECSRYPCYQDTDLAHEGLSGSGRQIFLGLQAGLINTVLNEKHNGVLLTALKALSLYISAAPFSQLPSDILSNIVLSISKRIRESNYFLNQSSILSGAIACLRASLSIAPSSTQLYNILSKGAPSGSSNLTVSRSLLVDLITYSQVPAAIAVQVEAIQALKAAAHNYPRLVAPYWDDIFKVLVRVIDSGTLENRSGSSDDAHLLSTAFAKSVSSSGLEQSSRLSEDELVQSAIELLDELLRVASDFEVPRQEGDGSSLNSSLSPQLSEPPEAVKLLCSPKFATHNNAAISGGPVSEQNQEEGSLQWLLALERLLPGVLRHRSPMVRGAGLLCFARLTPAVFSSLPAPKQEFILSTIMRASQCDDIPAVRSAACRAVDVIVGFPQAWKSHDHVAAFMSMLILRIEDSTPERLSVSWALANLCDGLCSYYALVDPMEAERILGHLPLGRLFACIFEAAKDADIKVCVNALRALGKLGRILNFKNAPHDFSGEVRRSGIGIVDFEVVQSAASSEWLRTTVQTFLSCSTSENVEAQWNVCYAVGKLFQNPSINLSASPWAATLIDLLQLLLRGSESLEVQMHAAAALGVPVLREDYGTAFGEVVRILAHTLNSLDSTSGTRPAIQPAAEEQLGRTLLHFLGLGVSEDYLNLKDVLEDLASFLQRWLSLIVLATKRAPPQGFESLRLGGLKVEEFRTSSEAKPKTGYSRHNLGQDVCESEVRRAVKALMDMYIYGGNVITAKKFQRLL